MWILLVYIRLVEYDATQLRLRYSECSGQVRYETDREHIIRQSENGVFDGEAVENSRMYSVQGKVATRLSQVEEIGRMVGVQSQFFSRLGSRSTAERQCARLLSTLRRKIFNIFGTHPEGGINLQTLTRQYKAGHILRRELYRNHSLRGRLYPGRV